jgi:protein Mpv17
MGTACVIGIAGDGCMQFRETPDSFIQDFDFTRSCRLAIFRMVQAPAVDLIWQVWDTRITLEGPAKVAAMVVLDQLLIAPPSILAFFYSQSAMEGKSDLESRERALTMWTPVYSNSVPFWCCAHTITFGFVPSHLRIAWASSVAIVWNAYVSGANQSAKIS